MSSKRGATALSYDDSDEEQHDPGPGDNRCVVFVSPQRSKFPEDVKSQHIFSFFRSKYGKKVTSAYIIQRKNKTRSSKGYGRVKFVSNAAAMKAISELTGHKFKGIYPLYLGLVREPETIEELFQCSNEHMLFLTHCLFSETDAYNLLSLKQALSAKTIRRGFQIYLVGYDAEVQHSKRVLSRFLARLHSEAVSYQCTDRQTYQCVLREGYIPRNVAQGITCIVQTESPLKLTVHIFGQDNGQLQATTRSFQGLKPQSVRYTVGPITSQNQPILDQFLANSLKEYCTVGTRVNSQVLLYGLRKTDIEASWRAIQIKIKSFSTIEKVPVRLFQLKYIECFQSKKLQQIKSSRQCKVLLPSLSKSCNSLEGQYSISIEGSPSNCRSTVDQLKALLASCALKKCTVECPRQYLGAWKKRWEVFKTEQRQEHSVIVQYTANESSLQVSFEIYGAQQAVQRAQTQLLTKDNGKSTKTHIVNLTDEEFRVLYANFKGLSRKMEDLCSVCLVHSASTTKAAVFAYPSTTSVDIAATITKLKALIIALSSVHTAMHIHITDVILVEAFRSAERKPFPNEKFLLKENGKATIQLEGEPKSVELHLDQLQRHLRDIKASQITSSTIPVKHTSIALSSEMKIKFSEIEKRASVSCYVPVPKSAREVLEQLEMKRNGLCCTVQLCNGDMLSEKVDAVIVPIDSSFNATNYRIASEIVKLGGQELGALIDEQVSEGKLVPGTALECSCEHLPFHTVIFAVIRPVQSFECTEVCALKSALGKATESNFGSVSITDSLLSSPLERTCKFYLEKISASMKSSESFMHTIRIIPSSRVSSTSSIAKLFQGEFLSTELSPAPGSSHRWFWKDDNERFVEYSPAIASQLTEKWQEDPSGSVIVVINAQTYLIDIGKMYQCNMQSYKLRDIKHRVVAGSPNTASGPQVQWMFQDDTGTFSPYGTEESKLIEQMYSGRIQKQLLTSGKWTYKLDLKKMTQTNIRTMKQRTIKRHVPLTREKSDTATDSSNFYIGIRGRRPNIEYAGTLINTQLESLLTSEVVPLHGLTIGPKKIEAIKSNYEHLEITFSEYNVSLKGDKESVNNARIEIQSEIVAQTAPKSEYPPEWDRQISPCVLKEVDHSSAEWTDIESHFKTTMSSHTVTSIKRVQNQLLWGRYRQERETIERKNQGDANEKLLFHGSRGTKAEDIVDSDNGFDMRVSSTGGMWGVANYFAEKASYSDSYAYQLPGAGTSSINKEMIVAKVITGDSVSLQPDHHLRMPPQKYTGTGLKKQRYDTVNGVTHGSTVYMTYDNAKAYPAYVLTYHKTPASFVSSFRKIFGF